MGPGTDLNPPKLDDLETKGAIAAADVKGQEEAFERDAFSEDLGEAGVSAAVDDIEEEEENEGVEGDAISEELEIVEVGE